MADIYQFFYMDGYAYYVWSAYGISFIVLVLNIILPMKREKSLLNKLRNLRSEKK